MRLRTARWTRRGGCSTRASIPSPADRWSARLEYLPRAQLIALLADGWQVRSVARGDYPTLRAKGVETVRGDLAEEGVADEAVSGCEAPNTRRVLR